MKWLFHVLHTSNNEEINSYKSQISQTKLSTVPYSSLVKLLGAQLLGPLIFS